MIWKKLTIETSVEAVDLISEFLNENGAEGVLIEDSVPLTDDELKEMFVDVPLMADEDDGSAKISCFLKSEEDADRIKKLVIEELNRLEEFLPVGSKNIMLSDTTDDTTWNDNWKQYYKPFRLYDNLVIEPVWEEYPDKKPDDKVIKIDSVMAFGTGTHETTKLCLGQLEKYISDFIESKTVINPDSANPEAMNDSSESGPSVFDVGCGSGILSIAAVKMGAGYVHGLDIDPQAVDSSKINAAANNLSSDRIDFSCGNLLSKNYITDKMTDSEAEAYKKGSLGSGISTPLTPAEMVDLSLGGEDSVPARRYDIVVANILADVIIPLSGVIAEYLNPGGTFITSGIVQERRDDVINALKNNGFTILDTVQMNEWVSVVSKIGE